MKPVNWATFTASGVVAMAGTQQFNDTAMEVPESLVNTDSTQLRLVNGSIVDGALLTSFFIDGVGTKCSMNPGGLQPMNCSWSDQLVRSNDGTWYVATSQAGQKTTLLAYAGNTRYSQEIGGIAINGMNVRTSRDSQQQITTAYQHAVADPTFTWDWKDADGIFRHLDANDIISMSDAVKAHTQDCFSTEKDVVDGINNGTITTTAQIDAAFSGL